MTRERPERTRSSGSGGRRRYAASGRAQVRSRKRRGWRRFFGIKAFLLYFLGLGLLGVIGVGVAYTMTTVPEPNDFAQNESTIVYWSDGKTELGRFSKENREVVDMSEIPPSVQDAVIAAEDRTFYSNSGFDPVGIARAGFDFVRGGGEIAGGGSTITQQYVKNYYLTDEQTLKRKAEELFISVKIDQEFDKDDILENYLNTVWFGGNAYGVQTASKAFFGKPVAELNVAQSAALAAIIKHPPTYDPRIDEANKARFDERFQYVVDGMVEIGAIDQAAADKMKPPKFQKIRKARTFSGTNGYLLEAVRNELTRGKNAPLTEDELNTGGYKIVTTFDKKAQKAAVEAVEEQRPKEAAKNVHVGLAAVKPGDGAVVAMYGGRDAVEQGTNDATQAKRQPGSAFKPFALAAALEQGISLESRFAGNSPFEHPLLGEKGVGNQDDSTGEPADYGKYVDLLEATERSINTAYVDLAISMDNGEPEHGAELVADAAERAGIRGFTAQAKEDRLGTRLTIGTGDVTVADMATAYATFAAGGKAADRYMVTSVTDRGGNLIYEGKGEVRQEFDPKVAADVSYALQQVVESENGTGQGAQEIDRPSAGKTGTHEELTAWYTGYTPQLSAAVSIFREDYNKGDGRQLELVGVEGDDHMAGGSYPLSIWTAFMEAAMEGMEVEEFPERGDVGEPVNPKPTRTPDPEPSDEPTDEPSGEPTDFPTDEPTDEPTESPTEEPDPTPTEPPEDDEWGGGNQNGNQGGNDDTSDEDTGALLGSS